VSEEEARRQEAVTRLVIALLSLAVMTWYMIPEHRRTLMLMRLAAASRRLCERAALRTGHQGMSLELETGTQAYHLPYLLSRARDEIGALYDRLRNVA